jgi:hypothetical protein
MRAEPGRRLQRVAEGVAQVQQCPVAAFMLVAGDDPGLHLAGPAHRVDPRRAVAVAHGGGVFLQPLEEARVAQKPIFGHLAVACQEVARRQCLQHIRVRQHQPGLVEGANQVLAVGRVDPGLAADRTIDLGQQRCRHLDEIDAAAKHRRGEARQVADHTAAEGDDQIVALDLQFQQPLDHLGQPGHRLGRLARRQHDGLGLDASPGQPGLQRFQMQPGDGLVGDDHREGARQQRADEAARPGDQPRPDMDVVTAPGQIDMNRFHYPFPRSSAPLPVRLP